MTRRLLRWVSGPERLTTGLNRETDIALSPDGMRLAFTARTESTRVWSLPFDARVGRVKGDGQPVTPAGVNPLQPDLSPDGKRLVYIARRPGTQKEEMWEKSLEDGRETLLASDDYVRWEPYWSRDGTRLLYACLLYTNPEHTAAKGSYCLMPAGGGEEQIFQSTAEFEKKPSDMSPDGRWLLGFCFKPPWQRERTKICLFPAAPHTDSEVRVLASDPVTNFYQMRFSPDEKWISCIGQKINEPGVSIIYVMPAAGGGLTPVAGGRYWADKPRWSPDGKMIYLVSNRDSAFFNVWGIRFDPVEGKPTGEPVKVTSFESPGRMIFPVVNLIQVSPSADRLIVPVTEATGSVWVLDGVDR